MNLQAILFLFTGMGKHMYTPTDKPNLSSVP